MGLQMSYALSAVLDVIEVFDRLSPSLKSRLVCVVVVFHFLG